MIINLIYNDFNKNIDIDISKTIGKIQEELLKLCSLIIYNIEYSVFIIKLYNPNSILILSDIENHNNYTDSINNKAYILGNDEMLFNDIFEKVINKIGLNSNSENIKIIIYDRKRDENGNVIKENKIIDKYNKWYQNQETENYINYLNDESNISNRNIIRYPLNSLLTNILGSSNIYNENIRNNLSHNLSISISEKSNNRFLENISESVLNEESMIPKNLLESEEKEDQIISDSVDKRNILESGDTNEIIIPLDTNICMKSKENNETTNSNQILSESDELSENIIENTLFEILNRNLNLDNIINDVNLISENLLNENINMRETRMFNRYFNTINNNENISSSLDPDCNISLSEILFSRLQENINNSISNNELVNNDTSNNELENDIISNDNLSNNDPSNDDHTNDDLLNDDSSNDDSSNNNIVNNDLVNNNLVNDNLQTNNLLINNLEDDTYDDLPELEYIVPQNLYNNNIYGNYSIPLYLNNSFNNTFNNSFLYSNISIFNTLMNEPILTQEDVIVVLTEEQFDNLEHKNYTLQNLNNDQILNSELIHEENKIKECFICMENFLENEVITKIKCNHIFHKECIKPWLCKQSTKCPICRVEVDKGTPIFNNSFTHNNDINEPINEVINNESYETN